MSEPCEEIISSQGSLAVAMALNWRELSPILDDDILHRSYHVVDVFDRHPRI